MAYNVIELKKKYIKSHKRPPNFPSAYTNIVQLLLRLDYVSLFAYTVSLPVTHL